MSGRVDPALVVLAGFLFVCALLIGCVADRRMTECHAKGGEVYWFEQTGGTCVSPDGRILR